MRHNLIFLSMTSFKNTKWTNQCLFYQLPCEIIVCFLHSFQGLGVVVLTDALIYEYRERKFTMSFIALH